MIGACIDKLTELERMTSVSDRRSKEVKVTTNHTVRVVITHVRNVASVVKLSAIKRLLAPGRVAGR